MGDWKKVLASNQLGDGTHVTGVDANINAHDLAEVSAFFSNEDLVLKQNRGNLFWSRQSQTSTRGGDVVDDVIGLTTISPTNADQDSITNVAARGGSETNNNHLDAVFTATSHNLSTGDYITTISTFSAHGAYCGMWYVEVLDSDTFVLRKTSNALDSDNNSANVAYDASLSGNAFQFSRTQVLDPFDSIGFYGSDGVKFSDAFQVANNTAEVNHNVKIMEIALGDITPDSINTGASSGSSALKIASGATIDFKKSGTAIPKLKAQDSGLSIGTDVPLILPDLSTNYDSITPTSGYGAFYVKSDKPYFKDDSGTAYDLTSADISSALPLSGGTMTGDITLPDDGKVVFGDAGEYISGDGTDLEITSSGDINLNIQGGNVNITDSAGIAEPQLTLKGEALGYSSNPILKFDCKHNDAEAADDGIGSILFSGYDSDDNGQNYADIVGKIADPTSGSEGGKLLLRVASHDGGIVTGLEILDGDVNDELDVNIGSGTSSVTTIAGNLTMPDDGKITLGDADEYIKGDGSELVISSSQNINFNSSRLGSVQRLGFSDGTFQETAPVNRWSIQTGGYRSNINSDSIYYFQYRPNGEHWGNTDSSISSITVYDSYASMLIAPYDGKVTKISVHGYATDTGAADPLKFYVFKGTPTSGGTNLSLTQIGVTGTITPVSTRQFVENTDISSSNTFSENDAIFVMLKKDSTTDNTDIYFSVTVSGEYTD